MTFKIKRSREQGNLVCDFVIVNSNAGNDWHSLPKFIASMSS